MDFNCYKRMFIIYGLIVFVLIALRHTKLVVLTIFIYFYPSIKNLYRE